MTHQRKNESNLLLPKTTSSRRARVSRRTALKASAAGAAAIAASPRIVFAQESTPAASPVAGGETFIPSGVEGVPDVYLEYPQPEVSYDGVPGSGGTVTAFTIGYNPPPTTRDDNQYWQELERRLGVTWEIDITPQPNYGEKSAVYLAGGELPDLYYINPG
nr:twin-arginine translocation signal domain-containing protein [Chloroflexia bacterium]